MVLEDLIYKAVKSKDKFTRRDFFKKSAQLGAVTTAAAVLSKCGGNGNGNGNGVEYKIITTWKANYTLEGTEATGKVKYYTGGTYNTDNDSGTLVKESDLGQQVELGTAPANQTKSFDVVVEAVDGLRKVYKNVAMSETKTYNDDKEGVLKLSGFNLNDYVNRFLLGDRNDRWRQTEIKELSFNPDIAATTLSGQTLFNMSDFTPKADAFGNISDRGAALERGLRYAKNQLRGKKSIVLYDGSDFENREALIKWADYLKNNIGNIKEVKDLHQAQYEGLDKLKAQGYDLITLNSNRLPNDWIDETIRVVNKIKDNSAGFITSINNIVRNGNHTANDLPVTDGHSWVFYDSEGNNPRNGIYPLGSEGPIDANRLHFNSDKAPIIVVENETIDGFFRDDQDYKPDQYKWTWQKLSFMRPAGDESNYRINVNYEKRDSVPSNLSVQSGALQAVEVRYTIVDPQANLPIIMRPGDEELIREKKIIRDLPDYKVRNDKKERIKK
ncbi:hypothetical protein KKC04_04090 [Patescibacteria group bacterium]|nr:hypothetical protein [Patescibacteria group bacterium]